ncbi:MAG TPA: prepilin-type N-terminal cleavage/methylation domain-containing protein [Steroidobacteraceae bacterium]
MRREHSIRGFTLLETCCVIVIAGILAAIAGPKFLDTPAFDMRGYTDELASAIRSSESVAAASGCPVQLTIAPGTGYNAELPATAATCSGPFTVAVTEAGGGALAGKPPSGADVATAVVLDFNPDGSIAGAAPVANPSITVVGSPSGGAQPLTLQVDALSGFVTVP